MSNQPKWRKVANLGDVTPLDYGGYFVYRDTTGVYPFEAELLEVPESADGKYTVHRFVLDRCKVVDGYLVPAKYDPSWTHPVHCYDEWFHADLDKVAETMDLPSIRDLLCSADPIELAVAYRAIGEYHGYANLDAYPIELTRAEARKRYRRWL